MQARGKFIYVGDQKLYVRGVTYGTFRPDANGDEFPPPNVAEQDFAIMAANGVNAVRTYTPPPRWLLDAADRHGLRLMVGLAAERVVGYLNDGRDAPDIEAQVRARVRACAGHPAVLCYAIANEIPAATVRWLGRGRVERFLERLCRAVKVEDPAALVAYVNYPSTEYLELPFLDLVAFNVYLETQERLDAYLARLQNLAGDRPLIMGELGLDSARNGEAQQAGVLDWQVRTAFASGCAGVFVYAWTDQWYRSGEEVEDWDFGLTRRDRSPKPALEPVRRAFAEVPFPPDLPWPRISVVVCSHNGARTIRDCCEGLRRLEYPDVEVIVVDDGSTDATAAIARAYGFRVVSTPNRGLSAARNTGLEAATGEIVAYIDDDAYPDPHWLAYLAWGFLHGSHAALGGPNLPPADGGWIAAGVANAPGGPVHVLVSDREAEHLPGCNLAVRRASLQGVGGFDPQFWVAGDDVDVCWRLQARGWTLGFHPAAVVWHHRRNSLRAYWWQQVGYGKAEALLERKWPEKYNSVGHLTWRGRVYGRGVVRPLGWARARIYQGIWGTAPFQALYEPAADPFWSMALMPEWYLVIAVLAALAVLGLLWAPLLMILPALVVAAGAPLLQAARAGARATDPGAPPSPTARLRLRGLVALLHLLQPAARLRGRLRHGLTPWRQRGAAGGIPPWPRRFAIWCEAWRDPVDRMRSVQHVAQAEGHPVGHGGDYDGWDLEVRGGSLGGARLLMSVEEQGQGRQYVRVRVWPRIWAGVLLLLAPLGGLALAAARDGAWAAGAVLLAAALLLAGRAVEECAVAMASLVRAFAAEGREAGRQLAPAPGETSKAGGG